MRDIKAQLASIDWEAARTVLHDNGFATVKNVLDKATCEALIAAYKADNTYRKTITMERYRFGLGEYKYFRYPLPQLITDIRETVYEQNAPVAYAWKKELNIDQQFPATHAAMLEQCRSNQQVHTTVLILKYGKGGFNTLHQDLYGEVFFPMQMVFMQYQEGVDYTGGEFVITEQIPRAQSKANVLKPGMGDLLLFTTNFRPVKGSRGYYRVSMKHGVSQLHSGHRHSLGIIFHDAKT